MTQYIQDPALWALVVVILFAAAAVVRGRKTGRKLRQEITGLREHNAELEKGYARAVEQAQGQAEEETKTVLKSAMRTLQGHAAEQQKAISALQDKYGDSEVLADLLEIDHMNSQFGRRAQSIAVLCDGYLGRSRDVASVYDVVRSAQGRIRHFQRVEIFSQVDFCVTGRAVEPVAVALAELLDNATRYSQHTVEINIRGVHNGVSIQVDDAGVGMNEEERARAAKLLSSERASGVAGLGNPPQFGFAVIGRLCERFGFTVSVDLSSPYGGVRAVVLLPSELLTSMPEPKERAETVSPVPSPSPSSLEPDGIPSKTADGLPRRRRKQHAAPLAIVPQSSGTPAGPVRADWETASIMGALQKGTLSGRAAHTDTDPAGKPSSERDTSSEGHEVS